MTDEQGFYVEPGQTYGRLLEADPERRFVDPPEAPVRPVVKSKVNGSVMERIAPVGDVERQIRAAFPDAPIMVDVAKAESQFQLHADNPRSTAYSVFQILEPTFYSYGCKGERGILEVEIACARKIYDKSGTTPWDASKSVWGKSFQ